MARPAAQLTLHPQRARHFLYCVFPLVYEGLRGQGDYVLAIRKERPHYSQRLVALKAHQNRTLFVRVLTRVQFNTLIRGKISFRKIKCRALENKLVFFEPVTSKSAK